MFQAIKFRKFLEFSFEKLSDRNIAVDIDKDKEAFRKIPLFKKFVHILSSFTFFFRLINRSSLNIDTDMKSIASYSEKLKIDSSIILKIISNFQSTISYLSTDRVKFQDELKSVQLQMQEMLNKNKDIYNSSNQISAKITEGVSDMDKSVFIIGELVSQNKDLKDSIHSLWSNFGIVTNIVKDLVKQGERTRLLALNAEIESAHAGVHGKGFEIVAQEMGKVAEENIQTAKKIINGIDSIREDAKMTEINVDSLVDFATEMESQVKRANGLYKNINNSTERVMEDSTEFIIHLQNLEKSFKGTEIHFSETSLILSEAIERADLVQDSVKSQWEFIDKINQKVSSGYRVTRILNSLISQFTISDFKNVSAKQKIAEELLEKLFNIRGIIVTILFSKEKINNELFDMLEKEFHSSNEEMNQLIENSLITFIDEKSHLFLENFNISFNMYSNLCKESLKIYSTGSLDLSKESYDSRNGKTQIKKLLASTLYWMSEELI